MNHATRFLIPLIALAAAGCTPEKPEEQTHIMTDLTPKIARYAPVHLTADTRRLTPGDRAALAKLIEAAGLMDSIYLRQEWSGTVDLLAKLRTDSSPEGRERLRYFLINLGPWSDLDGNAAFIPGIPSPRPPGANYYPADMSNSEFTAWLAGRSESERKTATGYFTVIRRNPAGQLTVVPYSREYREFLDPAAKLLREAADLTTDRTLKRFLETRAAAFSSNDYYDSDVAWMELDSQLEPTIGPYEVYMDELFNYKAAFEAFITIRNQEETDKLAKFSGYLQEIENTLPIPPRYRNPRLGSMAPIVVVDQVATGGEARAGVMTAAFNLPNDERVVAQKGSKRVMLKNVQEAKFETILKPIAAVVIDSAQRSLVAFEPFFTHILAHELMHGLGPHTITVGGKTTTVRMAMKEISSALEEAKADVAGLFALQELINRGALPTEIEQPMYVTFLASTFRSVRFGIGEAHGRGVALIFHYLMKEGAYTFNEQTGTFAVNFENARTAVKKLTGEIMLLQARGDYAGAKALLDTYAVLDTPMRQTLAKLSSIPVDITPVSTSMKEE